MTVDKAVRQILAQCQIQSPSQSVLVGVSGIDGSGKGYIAAKLAERLLAAGCRIASINVDGWLHLPEKRFDPMRPAAHFYENGFRFDEMFETLIVPLRNKRSIRLEASLADATDRPTYRRCTYAFDDVDVVLVEGIFLFRRDYRSHFDLKFWIDCSYPTALERALARGQEGLPPQQVVHDYSTIYFPAQEIHIMRDNPVSAATGIIVNDQRLFDEAGATMVPAAWLQRDTLSVGQAASA